MMNKLTNLLQKCVFFALFAALLCQGASADVAAGSFYAIMCIPILIIAVIIVAAALLIRLIVKNRRDKGDE